MSKFFLPLIQSVSSLRSQRSQDSAPLPMDILSFTSCPPAAPDGSSQYVKVPWHTGIAECINAPITAWTCKEAQWFQLFYDGLSYGKYFYRCIDTEATYYFVQPCVPGVTSSYTRNYWIVGRDEPTCFTNLVDAYNMQSLGDLQMGSSTLPIELASLEYFPNDPTRFQSTSATITAMTPGLMFTMVYPAIGGISYTCYEAGQTFGSNDDAASSALNTLPGICYPSVIPAVQESTCPPGYSSGTFAADPTACFKCPVGMSCPGASSGSIACPGIDWLKTMTGMNFTFKDCYCARGSYCETPATQVSCPVGSFSAQGAASCYCQAGWFSSTGSTVDGTCQKCPSGSFSTERATSCDYVSTNCPKNHYADLGLGGCSPCPAGSFSNPGSAVCTCIAGFYSSTGYLVDGRCTVCPGPLRSADKATSCNLTEDTCPAGTTGMNCPSCGYWACSTCENFVDAAMNRASYGNYVPAGKTPAAAWQCYTGGNPCPAGSYCPNAGTLINCPAGTFNEKTSSMSSDACLACPAGTYSTTVGASASSTCTPCNSGAYSLAGASSCDFQSDTCPAGTYADSDSQGCIACGAGTWSADIGQTSSSTCQSCPAGTFSSLLGASSSSACQACPQGSYSSQTGASSNITCASCPAGTFSASTGAVSSDACIACEAGSYSVEGASNCAYSLSSCPAGTYADSASQACRVCVAGTFSLGNSTTCTKCFAGTSSSVVGAKNSGTCQGCDRGQWSQAGAVYCSPCSPGTSSGTYGANDITLCVLCAAGTYSSWSGSTSCSPCNAGSYSSSPGATSCEACPAGYFASQGGSTACSICQSGSYSTSSGSTYCKLCPVDTYSDLTGSTSNTCTACSDGTSTNGQTGQSSCH
jgi:Tyrosine-protein kinase ephrin type A/B receptor-like